MSLQNMELVSVDEDNGSVLVKFDASVFNDVVKFYENLQLTNKNNELVRCVLTTEIHSSLAAPRLATYFKSRGCYNLYGELKGIVNMLRGVPTLMRRCDVVDLNGLEAFSVTECSDAEKED